MFDRTLLLPKASCARDDIHLNPVYTFVENHVFHHQYCNSAGDSSLLFGEISGSALAGIEAALSRFLKPLLSESDGWGKADTEQKVQKTNYFVNMLRRTWKVNIFRCNFGGVTSIS